MTERRTTRRYDLSLPVIIRVPAERVADSQEAFRRVVNRQRGVHHPRAGLESFAMRPARRAPKVTVRSSPGQGTQTITFFVANRVLQETPQLPEPLCIARNTVPSPTALHLL